MHVHNLGFSPVYQANTDSVKRVLFAVEALQLCQGRDRPNNAWVGSFLPEDVARVMDENYSARKLRSKHCCQVLSFMARGKTC